MAEAHAAVAFSFSVTPDGFNVHVSRDALRAVYYSALRLYKKRQIRFLNRLYSYLYPANISSLGILYFITLIFSYFQWDVTFGFYEYIHNILFSKVSFLSWIFSCFISSLVFWGAGVLVVRYLLKLLLSYRGFMFEPRGKTSYSTKVWFVFTKLLSGRNPKLYSFQSSLPSLPVPALKDTINRYLNSVRPILNDSDYSEVLNLSKNFLDTIASRLQRYLVLKSWFYANYVTDWWEQYVYLAGREPIMVNSNYYGMGLFHHVPSSRQASRAAGLVHSLFTFRSSLDKEEIKPIRVNGVVPLCSAQYERAFNTCRIPGMKSDSIEHWIDSRHIAVYHKGRWFKVYCYKNAQLLSPKDLEQVLEMILLDTSPPCDGEEQLAALTAGDRVPWAEAREKHFSYGVNKKSLHAIEKAAFVLVLDDEEFDIQDTESSAVTASARSLLHGNCYNRWFDKSFNLVVYKNGRFGFNAEHSWADAPIICYAFEASLVYELNHLSYDENGKIISLSRVKPIPPEHLNWNIDDECMRTIENSVEIARSLSGDLHLYVMPFKHFGKGMIKTFKMSPDAFLQSALQLAYYRDTGHFALTYEASMTRLFKKGRTETVRSCTNQVAAFVRSMESSTSTDEERYALLCETILNHVTLYKEAMVGKGIDRHLFCLYVMSKYFKVKSPFLQKVLSEKWRLSTSQTSMDQTQSMLKSKGMCPIGGGFGPVADDGYGVSYIISHDDAVMFHISSKFSSKETDSERLARNIEKSLLDMRSLCVKMKKPNP